MGATMGTGNVADDDRESLVFADEGPTPAELAEADEADELPEPLTADELAEHAPSGAVLDSPTPWAPYRETELPGRGMYFIAVLEGDAIEELLAEMRRIDRRSGTYRIRVCIDEGLKIKVDEGIWSHPIGWLDPASIPPEPRALFVPHGPEGSGL